MSDDAIEIYVDADACPVKDEVVRVALRHKLRTYFVSNSWMRLPDGLDVHRIVVSEGPDVADDWIATRVGKRSIVITADIPLASRCVKAGASVIGNTGKPMTDANIGMVLATRNLMTHLRETGTTTSYNAAFSKQDRSRFLQTLEDAVQKLKRA